MNYINQLNSFYDSLYANPLSSNAICLYVILFHINNKCNWQERFTAANMTIQGLSSISRNQLNQARNELIQKGYIRYQKGSGNQCGTYLLVRFSTQSDTQSSTQLDTQSSTQSDTQTQRKLGTLNKLNKTKLNNKGSKAKKEPVFDELIDGYTKNEELRKALKDHLKVRKAKRGALTNRAIELEFKELDKLATNDVGKVKVVEQAILKGWIGFFPVQEDAPKCDEEQQKERRRKMIQEAMEKGEV